MPPRKKKAETDTLQLKEITKKLNKEDLIKKLKANISTLVNYEQPDTTDEPPSELIEFSFDVAQPFIISHKDKDVRLLAACVIAEVLRICAPKPPYDDEQLKNVFSLFINQLHGLEQPSSPSYQRCFQLLESLSQVQSFVVLANIMDTHDLILSLFKTFFTLINGHLLGKVEGYMLDSMVSVIQYGENVPPDLLEVLLVNITEEHKSSNPHAYKLAVHVIQRAGSSLEPYVQLFFNNILMVGKQSDSEAAEHIYDLLFELHRIEPSVLLSVLPQLEFKLKSSDVQERGEVTRLWAKMFSDKDSMLSIQNAPLWNCFLGRFEDISGEIRVECVKHCKHFLVYHPEQHQPITERLCARMLDTDEHVRQEIVTVVCEAAAESLDSIPEPLFDNLRSRMRDRKWPVRKDTVTGVARLYRKITSGPIKTVISAETTAKVAWIPNKILHNYYQDFPEDKICVERCLTSCLVPVAMDDDEVMQRLLLVYTSMDDNAKKAFEEMLKIQSSLRDHITVILELCSGDGVQANKQSLLRRVMMLVRMMPDGIKTQTHLEELLNLLGKSSGLLGLMSAAIDCSSTRKNVLKTKADVILKIGSRHAIVDTVKMLLDRACPLLTDSHCISLLAKKVSEMCTSVDMDLSGNGDRLQEEAMEGMQLLKVLSSAYSSQFSDREVFEVLMGWLRHPSARIVEMSLEMFIKTGTEVKTNHQPIVSCLQPLLTKLATQGTIKQAKYAIRCFNVIFDESKAFTRVYESLVTSLDHSNPHLLSVLSSLGQVALLQPSLFASKHKAVVKTFVLKKLLMVDQCEEEFDDGEDEWCSDEEVSAETWLKITGHKLMVRWLLGVSHDEQQFASPVVNLLDCTLANDGDLNGSGNTSAGNRSRLRLSAACGLLRLARVKKYSDMISLEHFQRLALTIQDSCEEVRRGFIVKLHRGLITMQLPLSFLSILALSGADSCKQTKAMAKELLLKNIRVRRAYVKQHSKAMELCYAILPEYSLPYAIYLMAHHPDLQRLSHQSLDQFKGCLWMLLEPIVQHTDNFPFLSKLITNIKQTRDAQDEGDEEQNKKLYAICDLAHELLTNKLGSIKLASFPGEAVLPTKLFTVRKGDVPNTEIYLPHGYSVKKKPGAVVGASPKPTGSGRGNSSSQKQKSKAQPKRTSAQPKVLLDKFNKEEATVKPSSRDTESKLSDEEESSNTATGGVKKRKATAAARKRQKTMKEYTTTIDDDEKSAVAPATTSGQTRGRRKRKPVERPDEHRQKKSKTDSQSPLLDPPSASHDPLSASHDLPSPSHDLPSPSHDIPSPSHDPLPDHVVQESSPQSAQNSTAEDEGKELGGRPNVRRATAKKEPSDVVKIQRKVRRKRK